MLVIPKIWCFIAGAIHSSKIYGINVDTGVVFGEALTELGIDEYNTLKYRVVQVRLDKINKSNRNIRMSTQINEKHF